MFRTTLIAFAAVAALLVSGRTVAQVGTFSLESADGLTLHNVSAEAAILEGKKGLRLTLSADTRRRLQGMTPQELEKQQIELLATIKDLEFSDGTIEAEIAGALAPDAGAGARGFVGIAFRVQPDQATYDAFYLRPTNGRADDQERRNRSVQYISHPAWTWFRLRTETPAKYESYVDLVPGAWTKVKIEVRGTQGWLYVHGSEQPTLIVNDIKTGPQGKGGVALWLGPGTIGYFRSLSVKTTPNR